jgi:topoisomerase-4 subunit A
MQKSIDSLYAFTQCEVSISPLCCIISDNKPQFLGVKEILKTSTDNTKNLLKKELEIQLNELESQWHTISLERIFIENRLYRNIEEIEEWDKVLSTIYIFF